MSNYNPIYHTIWKSIRFNQLSVKSKYVLLYLLSNSNVTQTGIYSIMSKQIACDVDLSIEEVEESLEELEASLIIKYWQDKNIIFIRDNFRFARNMIKNSKILDKIITSQRQLYNIPEMWEMFDSIYSVELEVINKALMNH